MFSNVKQLLTSGAHKWIKVNLKIQENRVFSSSFNVM